MIEEMNIPGLLGHFKNGGFTCGERILLSHTGTVVTLLAVIFNRPIEVRLRDQWEKDGVISRRVDLVKIEHDGKTETKVMSADSKILRDGTRGDVIDDIIVGKMGLGHIVVKHRIPTTRQIIEVHRSPTMFWRTYRMSGFGADMTITEYFDREVFEDPDLTDFAALFRAQSEGKEADKRCNLHSMF